MHHCITGLVLTYFIISSLRPALGIYCSTFTYLLFPKYRRSWLSNFYSFRTGNRQTKKAEETLWLMTTTYKTSPISSQSPAHSPPDLRHSTTRYHKEQKSHVGDHITIHSDDGLSRTRVYDCQRFYIKHTNSIYTTREGATLATHETAGNNPYQKRYHYLRIACASSRL